jgi:hypothetical protein
VSATIAEADLLLGSNSRAVSKGDEDYNNEDDNGDNKQLHFLAGAEWDEHDNGAAQNGDLSEDFGNDESRCGLLMDDELVQSGM